MVKRVPIFQPFFTPSRKVRKIYFHSVLPIFFSVHIFYVYISSHARKYNTKWIRLYKNNSHMNIIDMSKNSPLVNTARIDNHFWHNRGSLSRWPLYNITIVWHSFDHCLFFRFVVLNSCQRPSNNKLWQNTSRVSFVMVVCLSVGNA